MMHQVHQLKDPNRSYMLQDNFRLSLDLKNSKEKAKNWRKYQRFFLNVWHFQGKQDDIRKIEKNREKAMHSETPNFLCV